MFIYALYTFVGMHTPQRTGLEARLRLDICFRAYSLKVSARMGTLKRAETRAFNESRGQTSVIEFSPISAVRISLKKSHNIILKKVPSSSIVLASIGPLQTKFNPRPPALDESPADCDEELSDGSLGGPPSNPTIHSNARPR